VASLDACEQALLNLVDRLAEIHPDVRGKYVVTRTLACRIPDLDVVFFATLNDDGIEDLRHSEGAQTAGAQVRLAAQSDDLIALVQGELSPPSAWATGRLKVEASVLDLLKLRTLL